MKSRIIRVFLVLTLILGGCQTTRKVTTTVTKDSTTTITARPVAIQIKPDTVTQSFGVTKFLQDLRDASEGHVIADKLGNTKGVRFKIIKTLAPDSSGLGFDVQATSAGKDTTIFVHDTITVIREKRVTDTLRTVEKPGLFGAWKQKLAYTGSGLILALLLLLAWQVERRIK